jgi:nicotinamidase-related amidase
VEVGRHDGRLPVSDSAAERDGITVREDAALVVVDVHAGFDDPWWGSRDNPEADHNIAALVEAFASSGRPMVVVVTTRRTPTAPCTRSARATS